MEGGSGSVSSHKQLFHFKAPIRFRTQSDDPISCYGKPVDRTNEIKGYAVSLVLSTGFLQRLIGSSDWVREWLRTLKELLTSKKKRVTSWNSSHPVWLPSSRLSSSVRLSSFVVVFLLYLTKTLSVESACLFFSSFVVVWWVHFPSSFPRVSTPNSCFVRRAQEIKVTFKWPILL